jgi:hypothetical protein
MNISGRASEEVTAAIASVIAKVLADEAAALAVPRIRPRQSDWVMAWRPRNATTPRPLGKLPSWTDRVETNE